MDYEQEQFRKGVRVKTSANTEGTHRLAIIPNCTTTWPINGHNCAKEANKRSGMNQKNGTSAKKGAPLDHATVNAKATTKVFQNASENKCKRQNMRNRRSPTPVATIDEKFALRNQPN